MDTKFSVALHILVFVAETNRIASSEALGESVNTNASHIRKITRLLKQAEILTSQQGKSGFALAKTSEEINLAEVYRAVYPEKVLLHIHEDPNPLCPVGQHIGKVLTPTFADAEEKLLAELRQKTLASLISDLYSSAKN